MHIELLHDFYL